MPIKIIRQDITKIKCDAIVDPTDVRCSHGGGADADIHEAAGVELYHACVEQGFLEVGKAIITPGFALPCKYVIHTVGPRWSGGENGEEEILRNCYREVLRLATENKCKSLAIPLIASGVFGFPKDKVLKIAVDEISSFLLENEMLVYVVFHDVRRMIDRAVDTVIGQDVVTGNDKVIKLTCVKLGIYIKFKSRKNFKLSFVILF